MRTGVTRIDFEMDPEELHAIGRVTTQWAYLEHVVFAVTSGIAKAIEVDLPTDARSTSFKRRLSALRLLVEECVSTSDTKRVLLLISKIANAEQDRHRVTHGTWDWDRTNPERISASSFRPGYEFEKKFDATKLNKLANTIGSISFQLEYPNGFEDAFAQLLDNEHSAFFSTSRRLHRELKAYKDQRPQIYGPTKPQEN